MSFPPHKEKPGRTPLIIRGKLFRQAEPALIRAKANGSRQNYIEIAAVRPNNQWTEKSTQSQVQDPALRMTFISVNISLDSLLIGWMSTQRDQKWTQRTDNSINPTGTTRAVT